MAHYEPPQILNFDFDADLDPAFHSDVDPDPASQNDADPRGLGSGSAPLLLKEWIDAWIFSICMLGFTLRGQAELKPNS
jgi:hypothetical protein